MSNPSLEQYLDRQLDALKSGGVYRDHLPEVSGPQGARATIDGRREINLASNNYLGLATHPKLKEAAIRAVEQYGAGSGAVRTIVGTLDLHEQLERRLAEFKGTESALVFQSGFTANAGVLGSILEEGDLVISDALNHASIIDGVRLTKASRAVYKHCDTADLRRILEEATGPLAPNSGGTGSASASPLAPINGGSPGPSASPLAPINGGTMSPSAPIVGDPSKSPFPAAGKGAGGKGGGAGAPGKILIVSDGVFSMDGDIAPLDEIAALADEFGAITMVDDAHGSGVLGDHGRGTVSHFGIPHDRWDITVGTLSKAVGVLGGYVACSAKLRKLMEHRARPFLFSTSHPPAVTAAVLAAIDILDSDEGQALMDRMWDNTRFFKRGLQSLGYDIGISQTPITPVIIGDEAKAMQFSDTLKANGVFATGIAFPTVAKGKARVRTIVTAAHTREDLEEALGVFERVGRAMGIIPSLS